MTSGPALIYLISAKKQVHICWVMKTKIVRSYNDTCDLFSHLSPSSQMKCKRSASERVLHVLMCSALIMTKGRSFFNHSSVNLVRRSFRRGSRHRPFPRPQSSAGSSTRLSPGHSLCRSLVKHSRHHESM